MNRPHAMILASAILLAPAVSFGSEELNIGVGYGDKVLRLTSKSGSAVADCRVYLNDGYEASVDVIPATGSADIWLTEFVSKGVLRFDPKLERVRRVHVFCRTPRGDALFK